MAHGNTTHGMSYSRKGKRPRLYRIWLSMKNRCYNPRSESFEGYGSRGISVCESWLEFWPFYQWAIGNGYSDDLMIERIDNDGNYGPDNCRWATRKEQANNTRRNVFIEFNGQRKTNSQWAEIIGITETSLRERFERGWSIEKALTTKKASNV